MKEGTRFEISKKIDDEKCLVAVTYLDTVQDIRSVEVPDTRHKEPIYEYYVVTKYLVRDDRNNVFTIYTNQIKRILNEHI